MGGTAGGGGESVPPILAGVLKTDDVPGLRGTWKDSVDRFPLRSKTSSSCSRATAGGVATSGSKGGNTGESPETPACSGWKGGGRSGA